MEPLKKDRRSELTRARMLAMPVEERKAFAMTGVAARRAKYPKLSVEKLKANRKAERLQLRKSCIEAYGNCCSCCGETTHEFLTIDHVEGGGRKHRQEVKNFYRWLRLNGYPPGFQVLCYNCNCCKGVYGSCVHQ